MALSAVAATQLAHLPVPFPLPPPQGSARVLALTALPLPTCQRAYQKGGCKPILQTGKLRHRARRLVRAHWEAKVVLEVETSVSRAVGLCSHLWRFLLRCLLPMLVLAGGRGGAEAHGEHGSSRLLKALGAGPGCLVYPRKKPGFVLHRIHL